MGINKLLCVFCLLFIPNLYPGSFDLESGLNNLASQISSPIQTPIRQKVAIAVFFDLNKKIVKH